MDESRRVLNARMAYLYALYSDLYPHARRGSLTPENTRTFFPPPTGHYMLLNSDSELEAISHKYTYQAPAKYQHLYLPAFQEAESKRFAKLKYESERRDTEMKQELKRFADENLRLKLRDKSVLPPSHVPRVLSNVELQLEYLMKIYSRSNVTKFDRGVISRLNDYVKTVNKNLSHDNQMLLSSIYKKYAKTGGGGTRRRRRRQSRFQSRSQHQ